MNKDNRCQFTWNPGVWPYVTRCRLHTGHPARTHVDQHNRIPPHETPLAGAVSGVVDALTTPDYRTSRVHREKLRALAIEWPSLAGALGELVRVNDREVPPALRQALHVLEAEQR